MGRGNGRGTGRRRWRRRPDLGRRWRRRPASAPTSAVASRGVGAQRRRGRKPRREGRERRSRVPCWNRGGSGRSVPVRTRSRESVRPRVSGSPRKRRGSAADWPWGRSRRESALAGAVTPVFPPTAATAGERPVEGVRSSVARGQTLVCATRAAIAATIVARAALLAVRGGACDGPRTTVVGTEGVVGSPERCRLVVVAPAGRSAPPAFPPAAATAGRRAVEGGQKFCRSASNGLLRYTGCDHRDDRGRATLLAVRGGACDRPRTTLVGTDRVDRSPERSPPVVFAPVRRSQPMQFRVRPRQFISLPGAGRGAASMGLQDGEGGAEG
jgi:hypothetical protein